ncbi:MAG: ATP-dependent helicase, partial [Nocardioidaceae bacterium]|nr:ATP-dependent helicase [Nocardioidaceae bacterium]
VTVGSYLTVADEILALRDRVLHVHAADDTTQWSDIAILARQGAEIPEIVATLRRSGVPVEVVGLNGLLAQPEVQDVLAMLDVLDDVTANPSLLRILTGPLWRIGPRDLALLGRRAASLAGSTFSLDDDVDLAGALQQAVVGTDPADVLSLADALEDPGHGPYSPEALVRFKELAGRLTGLRTHISEPLVDFVRRVLHDLDLDIELGSLGGGNGMDNIALLLEAIATYAENDRFASLAGLLSYLSFESEFNAGMEVSAPSEADSVKLLTVHKAKGLEWKAVFVPFLSAKVFPSDKSRPRWITNASALPIELRGDRDSIADLESWDTQGEKDFKAATKLESDNEELRLGYVALTRAESALHLSGHVWGRTQLKPRGPSPYLETARDWLAESGGAAEPWCALPADDDEAGNPFASQIMRISWPTDLRELGRRRSLARSVRAHVKGTSDVIEPDGSADESADLVALDARSADLALLVQEAEDARRDVVTVPLPASLSATTALRLAGDPSELARDLARPMPRRPSAGARFGTRFHAWVEAHFGQQALLDPGDLPGKGDDDIADDADLRAITEAFRAGPYGDTAPFAIETPFSLTLGGQQVIGRIDAIYQTATGFEVVDWKTNQTASADAVQLAIYRLAWAELRGIDPALVTAAFYYVRLGEVKRFDDLPGREELTKRLGL